MVQRLYFCRKSTCPSNRLHGFSVIILRYYKDVYANSFFPHRPRLRSFAPAESFLLSYDLKQYVYRTVYKINLYTAFISIATINANIRNTLKVLV